MSMTELISPFFLRHFNVSGVTSLFTKLQSIVSKVTEIALELLLNNRWFILIAVTATTVGALLPFAGVPTLAALLAIKVTSLAAASVPVMATINADLFLAAAFVARGLDMAADWVVEKIAILLSSGKKPKIKVNSVMFRFLVPKPVDNALVSAGRWVAKNPLETFVATLIVGLFLAMTFGPGAGPAVALLALVNCTVSPLAGFLLNGLFGLLIAVPSVGFACCFPTPTAANRPNHHVTSTSLDSGLSSNPSTDKTSTPSSSLIGKLCCLRPEHTANINPCSVDMDTGYEI